MKKDSLAKVSRRNFIEITATAAAGFTIVPRQAVAGLGHIAPSDKLNIAGIGIGGKGKVNLRNMPGQNIVALCDVDWEYAEPVFKKYPKAKKWKDFRDMLEKQKDIDAVVIATPDHTHAIQAMAAMQLGKHVYCQKPLTHTVWESRQLTEAAKRYKVATQMGNEGHSNDEVREVTELIHAGVIGEVAEVHVTTNRPIWPQGLHRPTETQKVPNKLDWDLFLGTAPFRPYNEAYHPWSWRAWWDFGTGALGDMGCHVLDVPFFALNLNYPIRVQSSSTLVNTESAPQASRVEYIFPARKNLPNCGMPELKLVWHDGGLTPQRPKELPVGTSLGEVNLYIGTKGKIISRNYGEGYQVLLDDFRKPLQTFERIKDHELGGGDMKWIGCALVKKVRTPEKKPVLILHTPGPLSEMVLMGNLAIRLQGLERELEWDGINMNFKNIDDKEDIRLITSHVYKKENMQPSFKTDRKKVNAKKFADEMIKHNYRKGWEW